jgi:hypothetical protein
MENYSKEKPNLVKMTQGLSEYQKCYLVYKGCYAIVKHHESQARRNSDLREFREWKKKRAEDPEFAVATGLGTRVEVS